MNRAYYRLKKLLTYNEEWSENFLDVERHREISREALHEYYKQRPIFSFLFRLYTLPTVIISYFSDIIWWNRYYKCCKEIEIIRKAIKKYEQN
jgi:hypothetical protein